ncbi:serine/threonine protein kinase [Arthrobacter sp. MW3 TE3886]|uniref:serine/threonine protein kinase n=1 Tax=Arthrobacter sp. MW3 TE3886 TaxID=3156254 RepID=UPI003518C7D6
MEDFPPAAGAAPEVPGYDVGRLLGRGGSATVWLATEKSTGREFALKCFDAGRTAPEDSEAEDVMRREVRILSALEHSHLARAHAVVRLPAHESGGGSLGLVLDYAPGGSLATLVGSRGRLGPGETVTVLTPIAQALAYLHSRGFTHGDVAPGNVLFTAEGKPLLADLGVGRMVADAAPVSESGTAGFRDPAPVDAVRAGLQPERDVYSLAALGWYCLTGRAPEPGAQRPPLSLLAPEVPATLVSALEAGLGGERRQRPAAAEFAAMVYRTARAEPVDLSVSVHPTVIPQLLTRKAVQPGPGRRPGAVRAGLHRGLRRTPARRTPARRALLPGLAAATLLAGTWLLAGGGLASDAVAGLFPGFVPGHDLPGQAGRPMGHERPAAPSEGPAGEPLPSAADGGATAILPDLEALLASADPVEAVRGLARLRSLALSSGDFSLLDAVNAPESAAAASDGRIRTQLSASGHVLAGFSTSLTRIETTADNSAARAVVAVTTEPSAYREVDGNGATVAEVPAGSAQQLRLVLVPVDGRWRIQDVLPPGREAG